MTKVAVLSLKTYIVIYKLNTHQKEPPKNFHIYNVGHLAMMAKFPVHTRCHQNAEYLFQRIEASESETLLLQALFFHTFSL